MYFVAFFYVRNSNCVSCGFCIKVCPNVNISLKEIIDSNEK
ncbi:MAG: 4Fe-4S binding protein [Intestinibacter bartlettii]